MYHCISLSRKCPKWNVGVYYKVRENTPKEAFVIIVVIINGKEFGRVHQF